MLKLISLIFVMILMLSSLAMAATQTATMAVGDEFSWVGPSLVPINPNPVIVFGAADIDIESIGFITRFDGPSQNEIDYMCWDPNYCWNMLFGDGYRIDYRPGTLSIIPTIVSYVGLPDGIPSDLNDLEDTMTDMVISLPGNQFDGMDAGGLHWISCPFNHPVPFNTVNGYWDGANVKVTDGITVKTFLDATSGEHPWLSDVFGYYDPIYHGMHSAGYFTGVYDSDQLKPGIGYLVYTRKDNLALILPAYQAE